MEHSPLPLDGFVDANGSIYIERNGIRNSRRVSMAFPALSIYKLSGSDWFYDRDELRFIHRDNIAKHVEKRSLVTSV